MAEGLGHIWETILSTALMYPEIHSAVYYQNQPLPLWFRNTQRSGICESGWLDGAQADKIAVVPEAIAPGYQTRVFRNPGDVQMQITRYFASKRALNIIHV